MSEKSAAVAEKFSGKAAQVCIMLGCGSVFGLNERVYVCPKCGGPLEIECNAPEGVSADALRKRWESRATSLEPRDKSGVWRYRELLPFDDTAQCVTLFEGNTPIYEAPRSAGYAGMAKLRLKHQGCNPTGSFKDTGMTAAVTQALALGAKTVVCASTGNTAASLAAYAARAGLQAAILLPRGQITASKLAQSMDYGAAVFELDGNFDDCMRLIQELGDEPTIYVANSINPFRIEGQKTVAYEMMAQCGWRVPDQVVVPGGNMGNSSALGKGFEEMLAIGLIDRLPKLNIIQAEGTAPLATLFAGLDLKSAPDASRLPENALKNVEHPKTLATAIKIGAPVSWRKSLRAVLRSNGQIISVSEQEIADAKAMIGRDGIGCEPASATTVAGIRKLVGAGHIRPDENVVAVLTGHVLKDPDYVSQYHRGTLALDTGDGASIKISGTFANVPQRVAATKAALLENLEKRR
jgi:threonine synthase